MKFASFYLVLVPLLIKDTRAYDILLEDTWMYEMPELKRSYDKNEDTLDEILPGNCKDGYVSSKDGQSCCPSPQDEDHTKFTCTPFKSDCWARCEEGYMFTDIRDNEQFINCTDGRWMTESRGIFSGNLCKAIATNNESPKFTQGSAVPDFESEVCDGIPRIKNAVLKCSSEEDSGSSTWTCVVTCYTNYVLPNGKTQLKYTFLDGAWKGEDQLNEGDSIQSCFKSAASDLPPGAKNATDTEKKPNEGACKGQQIPPDETIGLARISNAKLGVCTNTEPLNGMVRCGGECHSTANYRPHIGRIELVSSQCFCCQAVSTTQSVMVTMECDKSNNITRGNIYIPTECECSPCTESQVITTTEEPLGTIVKGCMENYCGRQGNK